MNTEMALGSVAESERVGSLDLLRGIAVLGIPTPGCRLCFRNRIQQLYQLLGSAVCCLRLYLCRHVDLQEPQTWRDWSFIDDCRANGVHQLHSAIRYLHLCLLWPRSGPLWAGPADRSGIGGYRSLDLLDDLLAVVAEVLSLRAARVAVAFPGLPVSAANAANMTGCRASLFLRS